MLWSHSIGETITALMDAGMELTAFIEHDSALLQALRGLMVEDAEDGRVATPRQTSALGRNVHPASAPGKKLTRG